MFFGNQKFRRDCVGNTASENKIDQILEEFEIGKQKIQKHDFNEAPTKKLKQDGNADETKTETASIKVMPNEALDKILKAIKIEAKTPKCLELLKTLFKDHILELHPAHILQTVWQLTDVTMNYRRQDDRKYLLVILNIIIDKRDHCILKEYGNFYKTIDILRVNLLLFSDDSFQMNLKRFNEQLQKFTEEITQFNQLSEFERNDEIKRENDISKTNNEVKIIQNEGVVLQNKIEEPVTVTNQQQSSVASETNTEETQQKQDKNGVSAIRDRLMKKKQEKIKEKEQNQQNNKEDTQKEIKLITKQEAEAMEIKQKELDTQSQVKYVYTLSQELQETLVNKQKQLDLKRKLFYKAITSMKYLLAREWSKISIFTLIQDISHDKLEVFNEAQQIKIKEFLAELQDMRAGDSAKLTQRQQQESSIVQNATSSRNDVRKMNMSASAGAGDGLNAWANRQSGN